MTQEELIKEIKLLPPEDKRALLDVILQIVRDETQPSLPRKSVVEELHGIAKFEGDPPNDEEVKDMIADYLIEKYS